MTLRDSWAAFWVAHDPDDVFAYSTLKLVSIRDRYLGILHYGFQFAILLYILCFVLIYQKKFLLRTAAVGIVKLDVSGAPAVGNYDEYASQYCAMPNTQGSTLPVCVFPAEEQFTEELGSSLFVSSAISVTQYATDCSGTNDLYCTSPPISSKQYMVGNIYDFSVTMDHSANVDFGDNAPKGFLLYEKSAQSWSNCDKAKPSRCSKSEFQSFSADKIPMRDLLSTAGVNLNDVATEYLQGTPAYPGPLSRRQYGAVIFLDIQYDNIKEYYVRKSKQSIVYYYKPSLIEDVDDSDTVTAYTAYPNNRTVVTARGIRIIGAISGEIGRFDFQTMLIQLASALALIKVASTVVDLIAIYLLPRKVQYKNAKYQRTEDFSDIKDKEREEKRQKRLAAQKANEDQTQSGASNDGDDADGGIVLDGKINSV